MAEKYPAFVWCHSPSRQGCVTPELWYYEQHTGQHREDGKPIVKPHAAFHTLKSEDMDFDVRILSRVYPPPAGFKWHKQPFVSVDPTKQLNISDAAPNSVEVKPTE